MLPGNNTVERTWLQAQIVPDAADAGDEVGELEAGRPPRGLAEAAVRGEDEAVRGRELQAALDPAFHVVGGLDVIALHVDDADGDVAVAGDGRDDLEFREFAAGHFDVHLVALEIEERREHRSDLSRADGAALVVAEAEVGADAGAAGDRFHGAVEDVDEPPRVLPVGVAAHAGLIDADFGATGRDEVFEFGSDEGQEGFGEGPAIGVAERGIREEPPGERVRPGDRRLECRTRSEVGGEATKPLVLLDRAKATGGAKGAGDGVFSSLIVGRGAEAARGGGFQVDAFDVPVEREVEVEAGLFAIGDDVETGRELVVERGDDRVVLGLRKIVGTEAIELLSGQFKPPREGVGTDDRCSQGIRVQAARWDGG